MTKENNWARTYNYCTRSITSERRYKRW